MLRLSHLMAVVLAGALAGCSALINPDPDRLGPVEPGEDSGISLMDSGPGGFDAGPDFDAGDGTCTEGSRNCRGDTLLTCAGGMEVPQDCQSMGMFCDGDMCRPHVCTPNSRMCSADGGSVVSCNARGSEQSTMDCGDGRCDPTSLACEGGGGGCEARPLPLGASREVTLCANDDNATPQPMDGCPSMTRADSGDRPFLLELDHETRVTLELTDIDEGRAIDTILYVRSACEDPSSQVVCADDVACSASTADPPACFDGVDVRQSRVTVTLPAGAWYVWADAYLYSSGGVEFECGRVRLSARVASDVTPGG